MLSLRLSSLITSSNNLSIAVIYSRHKHIGPNIPSKELDEKLMKIVGYGNPYETKIVKKNEVIDPSYPVWGKQESLKWAKWSMLRHVKNRYLLARYWQYKTNMKNISKCQTLPRALRDVANDERISNPPREASLSHTNNRCSITSRSKGVVHQYKLSRMVWRDLADHGHVSGAIRAKWG